MDHGIVDHLLLVITVKEALSAFSAKFERTHSFAPTVLKGEQIFPIQFRKNGGVFFSLNFIFCLYFSCVF